MVFYQLFLKIVETKAAFSCQGSFIFLFGTESVIRAFALLEEF